MTQAFGWTWGFVGTGEQKDWDVDLGLTAIEERSECLNYVIFR